MIGKIAQLYSQRSSTVVILFFLLLSIGVFSDFVFTGVAPFPGNFMQGWYEPWKADNFENNTILLAHKPVGEDVFRHIVPFRLLGIEHLLSFELPLWNPYNGSGMPLLATLNSGFLDPFNILFVLFGDGAGYGLHTMLQFILIGSSMYWYSRTLKLSKSAALVSGLVYAFSGFVTVRLIFLIYGSAIALLPALLAIVERARRDADVRGLFLIPLFTAILIVSTQTQVSMYILGIFMIYAVVRNPKRCFSLLGFMFLGIGIAALQIVPTAELMRHAHITPGGSASVIASFLVPLEHLLTIPFPNFFGSIATYNYWGIVDYTQSVAYMGVLPVLLALVSLVAVPAALKTVRTFFTIFAVLSIVFAIDWPGAHLFYTIPIPILSTGAPSRLFFITTFCLSALAGIGYHSLHKSPKLTPRTVKLFILVIAGVLLTVAGAYIAYASDTPCRLGAVYHCREVTLRNVVFAAGAFGTQFVVLYACIFFRKRKTLATALFFLLVASIALPGIYNTKKYLPTSPTRDLFPENDVIRALRENTKDSRVFGVGEAFLLADIPTQLRIYNPQYYHPLYIYRTRELFEYANNGVYNPQYPRGDVGLRHSYSEDADVSRRRERVLNIDSVKYRLYKKEETKEADHGLRVWEDDTWLLVATDSALPRSYLATTIAVTNDPEETFALLFDESFDIASSAVVDREVDTSRFQPNTEGNAHITSYTAHEVRIKSESASDALLVLTDNYYPGWRATVDGEEQEILRTNYTFRGVRVPAGEHEVVFFYQPTSARIGAIVSVGSVIVLLLLYLARHENRFINPVWLKKIAEHRLAHH